MSCASSWDDHSGDGQPARGLFLISRPRVVSLTCGEQTSPRPDARLPGCDRIAPLVDRFGLEYPERRARDKMALKVEDVVDGSVHAEKTLGGARRLKALHFVLSSSHCLMRVFRPIVHPEPLLMRTGESEAPERDGVGAQLVGD